MFLLNVKTYILEKYKMHILVCSFLQNFLDASFILYLYIFVVHLLLVDFIKDLYSQQQVYRQVYPTPLQKGCF